MECGLVGDCELVGSCGQAAPLLETTDPTSHLNIRLLLIERHCLLEKGLFGRYAQEQNVSTARKGTDHPGVTCSPYSNGNVLLFEPQS